MTINILDYLENSTAVAPRKVAFSDPDHQITYRELTRQAKGIGSFLSSALHGSGNKPVAVVIDRNIESLIAFLGVVYSGNFYVPVDAQMPHGRVERIFTTLQPAAVVALRRDLALLECVAPGIARIVFEDAAHAEVDETRLATIRNRTIDTDPLYAMFTSGSTGLPKGAVICHRSVIDLIEQFTEVFGFSSASVFGNQAPFDFDVSVKDIYSTLKNCATLQVIPKVMFSFPSKLIDYINEKKINTAIWATSALRIVENLKALEKTLPVSLEKVMFSGEVMPNKVLNYWRRHLPDVMYVNLYGPTEITCNCSYYIVDRPFEDSDMLPIGIPFANTDILVLNDQNRPVGEDEMGEICVRGTSLALGYYNNPAETARGFCQNPLNPHYPELIYRTGDLGKYNARGELLFMGRGDTQIKHMGHRIELGEIEVAVNALPFLEAGCCLYDSKEEKIVLFYQAPAACDKEILLGLREHLPKYMLPNRLLHFEKLPMNKNAKIDRVKLQSEFLHASG